MLSTIREANSLGIVSISSLMEHCQELHQSHQVLFLTFSKRVSRDKTRGETQQLWNPVID